jgi:hypothetical protein
MLARNRAHKGIDQKLAFCQGAPKAAQGANLFRRSGLTVAMGAARRCGQGLRVLVLAVPNRVI